MKQPTLKELMIKGFEQVNKRLDNVDNDLSELKRRVAKIEVEIGEIRSLPTITKELEVAKAKDRFR